jgi:large subunit ribosomal protein L9
MRIVLREDIDKLGRRGEVVKVADGYARNYLLPKGKALPATEGNLKTIEREKRRYLVREMKEKGEMEGLATRLQGVSCTLVRRVGDHDALYGSVTAADIAEYLEQKEGIVVDKRRIQLGDPIKSLGIYTVPIKLHREVTGEIKVWVVKE